MSVQVLLNLSNELGKSDKMRGFLSILSLFHNGLIIQQHRSTKVRFFLSHYIIITYISHFWRESVKISLSFTHREKGRHYITLINL